MSDNSLTVTAFDRAKYFVGGGTAALGLAAFVGMGELSLVPALVFGGVTAYLSPQIRGLIIDHMPAPKGASSRSEKLRFFFTGERSSDPEEESCATEKQKAEQLTVTQAVESDESVEALQPLSRRSIDAMGTPVLTSRAFDFEAEEDDLIAPRRRPQVPFKFSGVLESFRPSLDRIYLATLETGEILYCRAEDLCHVALAGSTRGGKSSIMRMLMAQLCAAGAKVLILNPHYSRYILDKKEDWTPFEPYLLHDPMECRKYDVIEYYLRQVATEILPRRLDKFAHSQPVGKPYFLALDELPAIMKHVPDASSYLEDILREGAKVGIFLITAAQDFLVKTISPNGSGGAIRECYRSAYYVGGDATTAKILLDMPANQIEEDRLGRGTIMIRNWVVQKRSTLAYVPLVDNEALYRLLGPSTYVPTALSDTREQEEDLVTYMVSGSRYEQEESITSTSMRSGRREMSDPMQRRRAREQRLSGQRYAIVPKTPVAETHKNEQDSVALRQDEQQVLEAYQAGYKTGNAIAGMTGISGTRVNQCLNRLSALGLIDWQPKTKL